MKKNKFFSIFAIMAIAIVSIGFFFSCSDVDLSSDKQADLQYKGGATYELFDIYNPSNPFDIFGVRHNIYLEETGKKLINIFGSKFYKVYDWENANNIYEYNIVTSSVVQEELSENADDYHSKEIVLMNQFIDNPQIINTMEVLNSELYWILGDDFSLMPYYDEIVAPYYDLINTVLIQHMTDSNRTINQTINNLMLIENQVLSKEDFHHNYYEMLDNNEEMNNIDHLLVALSIMKHSLVYWDYTLNNKNSVWHDAYSYCIETAYKEELSKAPKWWNKLKDFFTSSEQRETKSIITAIAVVGADVGGGFAGGFLGASIASGLVVGGGIPWIGNSN